MAKSKKQKTKTKTIKRRGTGKGGKGLKKRCSNCRKLGHNARTCEV